MQQILRFLSTCRKMRKEWILSFSSEKYVGGKFNWRLLYYNIKFVFLSEKQRQSLKLNKNIIILPRYYKHFHFYIYPLQSYTNIKTIFSFIFKQNVTHSFRKFIHYHQIKFPEKNHLAFSLLSLNENTGEKNQKSSSIGLKHS